MKTKTTILLLGAALLLVGFIELYEKQRPSTRQARERDDYVLAFDRSEVEGIVINSNEDRIELRSRGNRWEMLSPARDRADQNAIAEILTDCETMRKETTLTAKMLDPKKLEDFGVSKANLRLKLIGPNMPPELWFGKETAVEGKTYVRLENGKDVFVTGDGLRTALLRKADDFRDRRLTQFDAAHTTQFSIKTAAGEIQVTKKNDHWQLDKPMKARGDDRKISDLVGALLGVEIVAFVPEKNANLSALGLAEPRATLTFQTLSEDQPLVLELGAAIPKTGNVYGRFSARGAVYVLPKRIERLVSLVPDELRDRHLLRVDLDIVDRLSIEGAGKPKVVLQRHKEDWVALEGGDPRLVNPAKVAALVKALQSREVEAFVADVASDLPKYGLDQPRLRVTFSSYSSENTAETTAGEHPFLTLTFGKVDGKVVYARIEDEPFIVSVDKALLDEIADEPASWRPLSVFIFRPEEIVSLEVTGTSGVADEPAIRLVRSGATWAAQPGSPAAAKINPILAQSLVNTLAQLRAVRWNPANSPAIADNGTKSIRFKTASGATHKLILGSPQADGTCPAKVDGDSVTFAVSAPDESALRLPLVDR